MTSESAIDSKLMRYAGIKSYSELARETGLDPEEVGRRTQEIFDRVMLSPEQMAAKNIYQLQEIVAQQLERVGHAKDEDVARLGNTAAGALGRINKEIDTLKGLQAKDSSERDLAMGAFIATQVEEAADRAWKKLQQREVQSLEEVQNTILTELQEIAIEYDRAE